MRSIQRWHFQWPWRTPNRVLKVTAYLKLNISKTASLRDKSPFRLAASVLWCYGHEKRRESSWSGPWHLGCTSEVFHVHSYQDQFIQPGWTECVFIFSLGLYFVCVCIALICLCPHPFVFPWAVESSPLQVLALA